MPVLVTMYQVVAAVFPAAEEADVLHFRVTRDERDSGSSRR